MSNTIFTVDLPFIETNEELEKVKGLYPQYDSYFIASGCDKKRREKFDKLWIKYRSYADRHFLNQIRTNFHQRSWEMYIGNVLLEKGLIMRSRNEGPDFVIDNTAYIECIAPTKGDSSRPDSVPEMFVASMPEEISVQNVPVDKMILRITQAVKDKALNQYDNWKSKKWFDSKIPFVIAINTGDLAHVEDPNMPNVLKALFGFQFMQINIKTGSTTFSHRDKIEKTNSEPVPVNYFVNENFSFVSGVIFSNKTILNHPENIGEDCIFVNNPFASNPIDETFSESFNKWNVSRDENGIKLTKEY